MKTLRSEKDAVDTRPRLRPRPWANNYLVRRALARQLRREIDLTLRPRAPVDVLDLGCGEKPYEPLFNGISSRYVGVDVAPGPRVDRVAPAEKLPFEEGSFDCVICTQMLEHVEDPDAVVREVHRILRPEGVALVSTHGVIRYHPCPEDYWRWTHTGLALLFSRHGDWASLKVMSNGGTATGFAYLLTRELEWLCSKFRARAAARPFVLAANLLAANVDRRMRWWYRRHPPAVVGNYLVAAARR